MQSSTTWASHSGKSSTGCRRKAERTRCFGYSSWVSHRKARSSRQSRLILRELKRSVKQPYASNLSRSWVEYPGPQALGRETSLPPPTNLRLPLPGRDGREQSSHPPAPATPRGDYAARLSEISWGTSTERFRSSPTHLRTVFFYDNIRKISFVRGVFRNIFEDGGEPVKEESIINGQTPRKS